MRHCADLWDWSIDIFSKSQKAYMFHIPYCSLPSEQKCTHFCSEWNIVGYGTDAFWVLWIRSILYYLPHFRNTDTGTAIGFPFQRRSSEQTSWSLIFLTRCRVFPFPSPCRKNPIHCSPIRISSAPWWRHGCDWHGRWIAWGLSETCKNLNRSE